MALEVDGQRSEASTVGSTVEDRRRTGCGVVCPNRRYPAAHRRRIGASKLDPSTNLAEDGGLPSRSKLPQHLLDNGRKKSANLAAKTTHNILGTGQANLDLPFERNTPSFKRMPDL